MKVGIINFHFAHNFGAVLECMALQTYIESLGHEVVVIDYRPEYMVQSYAVYPSLIEHAKRANRDFADKSFVYRCYRMFRRSVQALIRYKDVGKRKGRSQAFETFIQKNMHLTNRYKTIEELQNNPPECEVYISGSDQIWNPYVTNSGLDYAYFLDFGSEKIRRIAYAVSPCQLEVEKYSCDLKKLLHEYDAISLREQQFQTELSTLSNQEVEVCIDPTLLLMADDYNKMEICPDGCPEKYILVYGFDDKEEPELLGKCAEVCANEMQLPIIDISYFKIKNPCDCKYINVVSPGEFLMYIKNATYIVTNSFHGTAFSLIYHKNFLCVERKATASRMKELMLKVGLEKHLVANFDKKRIEDNMKTKIDYAGVDACISELKEPSIDFLNKALK